MRPARYPNGLEVRAAAELRAVTGRKLEGYAATFGTPAQIGSFVETIRAGAFKASLDAPGADIVALVDHDPGRLIARTRSGTLRLAEDGKGLAFSLDLPSTTLGSDLLEMATRGDLGGMSFGFNVPAGGDEWNATRSQRTLKRVQLTEVSVVHWAPAYLKTSVQARARGSAVDAIRARRRLLERL